MRMVMVQMVVEAISASGLRRAYLFLLSYNSFCFVANNTGARLRRPTIAFCITCKPERCITLPTATGAARRPPF
jgi:hypothetical protein